MTLFLILIIMIGDPVTLVFAGSLAPIDDLGTPQSESPLPNPPSPDSTHAKAKSEFKQIQKWQGFSQSIKSTNAIPPVLAADLLLESTEQIVNLLLSLETRATEPTDIKTMTNPDALNGSQSKPLDSTPSNVIAAQNLILQTARRQIRDDVTLALTYSKSAGSQRTMRKVLFKATGLTDELSSLDSTTFAIRIVRSLLRIDRPLATYVVDQVSSSAIWPDPGCEARLIPDDTQFYFWIGSLAESIPQKSERALFIADRMRAIKSLFALPAFAQMLMDFAPNTPEANRLVPAYSAMLERLTATRVVYDAEMSTSLTNLVDLYSHFISDKQNAPLLSRGIAEFVKNRQGVGSCPLYNASYLASLENDYLTNMKAQLGLSNYTDIQAPAVRELTEDEILAIRRADEGDMNSTLGLVMKGPDVSSVRNENEFQDAIIQFTRRMLLNPQLDGVGKVKLIQGLLATWESIERNKRQSETPDDPAQDAEAGDSVTMLDSGTPIIPLPKKKSAEPAQNRIGKPTEKAQKDDPVNIEALLIALSILNDPAYWGGDYDHWHQGMKSFLNIRNYMNDAAAAELNISLCKITHKGINLYVKLDNFGTDAGQIADLTRKDTQDPSACSR